MSDPKKVESHYAREGGLLRRIKKALGDAGLDLDALTTTDLAPIDQFHIRGHKATLEIGEALGLKPGLRALDLGSGVGGPARLLAEAFGAEVTGIDLTRDYVKAANWLTERTGLAGKVSFQQANALDLPFPDDSFDAVYTQHVAMNIEDKTQLYREARRVLKPGGRFALYDVMQGPGGPPHFPVPWALDETTSFLATPEEVLDCLSAAGFTVERQRDVTQEGEAWFNSLHLKASQGEGPPVLGVHLLLGPIFTQTRLNQIKNLAEGRILLQEMVAR